MNKDDIRRLKIIHFALVAGGVVFSTITYYLNTVHHYYENTGVQLNPIYLEYGILGAIFITILFNAIHSKSRIKKISHLKLGDKLKAYKDILMYQYQLIEGLVLGIIIFYMLTGLPNLLLYGLMCIVYMVYNRPNALKAIKDLSLDDNDADHLRSLFSGQDPLS